MSLFISLPSGNGNVTSMSLSVQVLMLEAELCRWLRIPILLFSVQPVSSWIHSGEVSSSKCSITKCHLLQLCCSSAACQQPALRWRPHIPFKKSDTNIKNSSSPSNRNELNSSLNHLWGLSGSTHFRIEDGNCYTILCHFLLSISFRSSRWQLTHIQEKWEEEGSHHHACSVLFISKFCGTLSLTLPLRWSSARLWQTALLTELRAACATTPLAHSTGSFSSPSRVWLIKGE